MRIITSKNVTNSTEKASDKYLELNSCGINGVESEDAMIVREDGRVDFHFLYVASGRCTVYENGRENHLVRGDLALFYPLCKQKYYFEKTGENKVYWAHFTGCAAEEILRECNFCDSGIYRVGYSNTLLLRLDRMISEYRMKNSHAVCHALLHSALAELGELAVSGVQGNEKRSMILSVATKMESNLQNIESIDDYAACCNLSRDRFVHLFKEITGWSPYSYMLNIRIEKAQRMLRFSSASVGEIAATFGFDDPLYFSRIFKKYTGVSPSEYREKTK